MSVQQCIRNYQLLQESFEIPRHTLNANRPRTLDQGNHLDAVIKSILVQNSDLTLQANPELCKTYVDMKLSPTRCLN